MPFMDFDSGLRPHEVKPELEYTRSLDFLIKDETEAVDGYVSAIALFEGNDEVIKKLTEIKAEEEVHIQELAKLLRLVSKEEEK